MEGKFLAPDPTLAVTGVGEETLQMEDSPVMSVRPHVCVRACMCVSFKVSSFPGVDVI